MAQITAHDIELLQVLAGAGADEQPLDLATWRARRQQGEEALLPSGLAVRLRRVSLLDLAEQGDIPAPLVGQVQRLLSGEEAGIDVARFREYAATVNLVVRAALVSPRVSDEAGPESIAVDELPIADRLAVFSWANRLGERLRPFRRQPDGADQPA